jgi:hypothetical protein
MYGYGEDLGEGYRYPSLSGQPLKEIQIGNKFYTVPVPTREWVATYYLNKKAKPNSWVEFMKKYLPELRKAYYEEQLKTVQDPNQRALLLYNRDRPRKPRTRHAKIATLIQQTPELSNLGNLSEEELLRILYGEKLGRMRRRADKTRQKLLQRALEYETSLAKK